MLIAEKAKTEEQKTDSSPIGTSVSNKDHMKTSSQSADFQQATSSSRGRVHDWAGKAATGPSDPAAESQQPTAQADHKAAQREDEKFAARMRAEQAEENMAASCEELKRAGNTKTSPEKPVEGSTHYLREAELEAELKALRELSTAAQAGDMSALDQLRQELDARPHIWQLIGDLQRRSEAKIIDMIADRQPLDRECFVKRLSVVRAQFQNGNASMPTQMAIGRIVMCWALAQYYELCALNDPESTHYGSLLLQAEKRLQTAYRTLKLATEVDLLLNRSGGEQPTVAPTFYPW